MKERITEPFGSGAHRGARIGGAGAAAALVGLAALIGCTRHTNTVTTPAVVVALPVRALSGDGGALQFPAEVVARYSTPVSFRVAGKILERDARLGDRVRKDQILARLDPSDAHQQAASAQAALDAATHRLAFAKQQLDRDTAQVAQNLIAAAQLEQTQDAYTAALDARAQAAAQLNVAQNNLLYNTLRADHDGLITSENADTGQVVTSGQAVYELAWTGEIDVVLDAPESQIAAISVGQKATVNIHALPERRFDARVREIAPAADSQSRTYRVKLSLTAPAGSLKLGMTGDVSVALAADAHASADGRRFLLPATALFHQGTQLAVWTVKAKDSTLELRPVTAIRYDARSATVTGGLRDGEQVVLAGVHTVFEGEKVRTVAPLFTDDGSDPSVAPAVPQ